MLESFNKVGGLKKRLQHRYFPLKFVKLSRTLFLQNTSGDWFFLELESVLELRQHPSKLLVNDFIFLYVLKD